MPDTVQKYFTAPSVPDHEGIGFRALTVSRCRGGRGDCSRSSSASPPGGEGCILCIPWGSKQLLLCVKKDGDDPSGPLLPQPEPSTPWQPGEVEGGGQGCHGARLLAISLAAPSLALFFRPLVIKTSQ